jgi:hypothetical protein
MIAIIDREFRLDQRDGQHFAASLVGRAACRRTQRAWCHYPAELTSGNRFDV